MKWAILALMFSSTLFAETSKIIPAVIEAAKIYVTPDSTNSELLFLRADIRAALEIFKKNRIDPAILESRIIQKSSHHLLRENDKYDYWMKSPRLSKNEVPEMAVHALSIKVADESDEWFKDDVYAYFFVTDGMIPTGKVTSIYKGISQGQTFFFNETDRAIFPLIGIPAKRPHNHLIIDYGIIESDQDDIKEMQKLSAIIIDIAIAVYTTYDPQNAQILINLRKEIKALAEMLLSLNNDDRLATGTFGWKVAELEEMLKDETYVEITKKHVGGSDFKKWEYHLGLRLLRN